MEYIDKLLLDFTERATKAFEEHPEYLTFAENEDTYLAIRWGMHDRAVLVISLSTEFKNAVIFGDKIDSLSSFPKYSKPKVATIIQSVLDSMSHKVDIKECIRLIENWEQYGKK